VFVWILYRLLWGCTVLTVSIFVHCLHSVSENMSISVLLLLLLIYGIYKMSEKFWYIFRKQWRELNDTWWDDRCGSVGSSDTKWARTLATLLLIWQHWCWSLVWTFGATTYHPTNFHFLLWINTWIRIFLAFCKMRLMYLHVIFRVRVISKYSRSAMVNVEYIIYCMSMHLWCKWQMCVWSVRPE
jgi:hypothetical protein